MLEDLKKKPELLNKFEQAIQKNKYFAIVSGGKEISEKKIVLASEEVRSCIASFEASDLVFVGANHGRMVSPLFALSVNANENVAILKEYFTFSEIDCASGKAFLENGILSISPGSTHLSAY